MRHKNGLKTSLLFFLKMTNNWVGRTTINGKKKEFQSDFQSEIAILTARCRGSGIVWGIWGLFKDFTGKY